VKMTRAVQGAAPAITDLIGGQTDVIFTTVASAASLIAGGQLRALAVTSRNGRGLPDCRPSRRPVFPAMRPKPGTACLRLPNAPMSSTGQQIRGEGRAIRGLRKLSVNEASS